MTMGYKWSEEDADEFLKAADPKSTGQFSYMDFITKILKR